MPVNLNEAIRTIKSAGPKNVRAVPMPGQNALAGMYRIEINESGAWSVVVDNIPKATAESLILQATNRVICG